MREVSVDPVDERDSSWENSDPLFRVYLHGQTDPEAPGWWTDTYDIRGGDVLQVVDWAQRQAGDSLTYAVALVVDDAAEEQRKPGCGRGLVWLVGMDANDASGNDRELDTQRRMVARRQSPVGLSDDDRMPPGLGDPYGEGSTSR